MNILNAVELAKKNDESGFTYLYEVTYQKNYYIALKFMKNEQSAMDVLQDAYIKAFKNLSQLEDGSKFQGWMSRITFNRKLALVLCQ